jgi:uncharacterized protein YndB with AHSA1/START domain/DNA-binding transcriptional ArsR family regulator
MANDAFSALAHPTRREIVERLSAGATTVGDASQGLGVSKPTVSRHLKLLEEAGVVTRVIDGRTHRPALRPETLAETSDWIESQRARWERLFDVVGEYLDERKGARVTEDSAQVVRIERTFDASAEDVFDAWTNEEVIGRWFRPGQGWGEASAEVDLRVGGAIRVVMRDPDGTAVGAGGQYTEIERPHRLAFTWTFDDDPSNQQMIELEFTEQDGATTVLFVNSNISGEDRRDSQYEGWQACIDNMERVLAA